MLAQIVVLDDESDQCVKLFFVDEILATYASKRFGSVRFRFGFCHIDSKPTKNQIEADSVRFDSVFFDLKSIDMSTKSS